MPIYKVQWQRTLYIRGAEEIEALNPKKAMDIMLDRIGMRALQSEFIDECDDTILGVYPSKGGFDYETV